MGNQALWQAIQGSAWVIIPEDIERMCGYALKEQGLVVDLAVLG